MSEGTLFRQYVKEAIRGSSKAKSENDKRALIDLACTWAQAALASERVWTSNYTSLPRDAGRSHIPVAFLTKRAASHPVFPLVLRGGAASQRPAA
jgi:hypothetical protein